MTPQFLSRRGGFVGALFLAACLPLSATPSKTSQGDVEVHVGYALLPYRHTAELFRAVSRGDVRNVLNIPKQYGKLIGFMQGPVGPILWFLNDRDEIHNLNLDPAQLMYIQREGNFSLR